MVPVMEKMKHKIKHSKLYRTDFHVHALSHFLTDYNWLITTTFETLINDIHESRSSQTLDPRCVRQQLGLTCYSIQ